MVWARNGSTCSAAGALRPSAVPTISRLPAPALMAKRARVAGSFRWLPLRSALVQHGGRIDIHGTAVRVGGAQLRERQTVFVNEN